MIAIETGFFAVFDKLRGRVVEFEYRYIKYKPGDKHWLSEGIGCPVCLSFYFGLIAAIFLPFNNLTDFVFNWLALSGAASFLYKLEHD
jgi:hypothetical protein